MAGSHICKRCTEFSTAANRENDLEMWVALLEKGDGLETPVCAINIQLGILIAELYVALAWYEQYGFRRL